MDKLKQKQLLMILILFFTMILGSIKSYAVSIELNSLLESSLSSCIVTSLSIEDLPLHYNTLILAENNNVNIETVEEIENNLEEQNLNYEEGMEKEYFNYEQQDLDLKEDNAESDLSDRLELNEEYIEWLNSSEEERKEKWGNYIPEKYIVKINPNGENGEKIDSVQELEIGTPLLRTAISLENRPTESYYNLKDKINIPVEDQKDSGWCWNYTSLKTLQTYFLKKNKSYNFAEYHLGYMRYKNFNGWLTLNQGKWSSLGEAAYKNGGSFSVFQRYAGLPCWGEEEEKWMYANEVTTKGPVTDVDSRNTVYIVEKGKTYNNFGKNPEIKVLRTVKFASISKTYSNGMVNGYKNGSTSITENDVKEFRYKVKSQIKTNGAIDASTNINENYFNNDTNSLYINNSSIVCNHEITIVGWNDNYSKNNFKSKPKNDGAWIALNSWGNSWGNSGYFYISYDDAVVEKYMYGVVAAEEWSKAPTVSDPKYSTTAKTNGNVEVTLTSFEKLQGISGWSATYTNWDKSNKYYDIYTKASKLTKIYTDNKTETITVKDESGKYVTKTIKITNIDKISPTVIVTAKKTNGDIYSYNNNYWSNTDVELNVSASDANGIDSYSFDGGSTWTKATVSNSNKYIVTSTKMVVVKVKDKVGNITTKNIQVNIDKLKPTFSVTKSPNKNWSNQDVTLTVNSKDNGSSGLNLISFDDGNTWKSFSKNTLEVSSTQIINIKVKDIAGNIASSSVPVNVDKTIPEVKIEGNQGMNGTKWVNKSKIGSASAGGAYITVKATDQGGSGIISGYVYSKDGITWKNSNQTDITNSRQHYYITENETVYFKTEDNAGNLSEPVAVEINMVDSISPTIHAVSQTLSDSKDKVTLKIIAGDRVDSKGIKSGISEYSFDGGETWTSNDIAEYTENQIIPVNNIMVRDFAGNETKYSKEIKITEIDDKKFEVEEPIYSKKTLTNKNVTVTIKANKALKEPPEESGWMLSSDDVDGSTIIKEYAENTMEIGEDVILIDANTGKSITKTVIVQNIDKEAPIVIPENIIYKVTEDNKEEVIVKANERLAAITNSTNGLKNKWSVVSDDPCAITTIFDSSKNGDIIIKDLAGNATVVHIEFSLLNFVINTETLYKTDEGYIEEGKITNQSVTVIIKADTEINPVEGWSLSDDKKSIIKEYDDYKEEEITLMDNKNNEVAVPIKVNIDKKAPVIKSVTGNPTKWTKKNVTLTVNAEDIENNEELLYSFDGGENWTTNKKKVYLVNTNDIQIAVKDSAGNITLYNRTIDITKIDKELPTLIKVNKVLSQNKRSATLTIEAEDNISGIKEYSFDGGKNWETSSSKNYEQNQVLISSMIIVRDNAGNEVSYNNQIQISEIDETEFCIDGIVYSTIDYTNQNVIVTITANKQLQAIDGWNLSEDRKTITKEYTENKKETIKLINVENEEIINQRIIVNNIDKQTPKLVGEIEKSTTDYTESVIISIPDIEDEGVAGLRYDGINFSYDEGQSWVKDDKYEYNSNGTKIIYIRDKAENILKLYVEIDNIDIQPPIIDSVTGFTGDNYVKDSATLKVVAHDDIELHESAYSFDGGKTYQIENTKTYTESVDDIVIIVRDKAGREILYNNGEKISLKVDSSYPQVSISGIPTQWNTKAILTVNAFDNESGIAGYSLDGKNYTQQNTYEINKNGTRIIRVKDNLGHITVTKLTINKIDNIQPIINDVTQEVLEDSNKIRLTVNAIDKIDSQGIASGIAEYSFDNGINWTSDSYLDYDHNNVIEANMIKVRDNAGNEAIYDKTIAIEEIDENDLEINTILYSTQEITNKNVVVKIVANKPLMKPPEESEWKLDLSDEEGKILVKEFEKNSREDVVLTDKKTGKNVTQTIEVCNIDKEAPVVNENNIIYQLTENNTMKVLLRANERIQSITDYTRGLGNRWDNLINDNYAISTEFSYSKEGNIVVQDLAGNSSIVHIGFTLKNPEISATVTYKTDEEEISEGEITNKPVSVIIQSDTELSEVDNWTISEDNKTLSKRYDDYAVDSIKLIDKYNSENTLDIPIKVNIDKYFPSITEIIGNPSNWTNGNVTLTVNAQDNGSSQELFYSFDGEEYTTNNKKTYRNNKENIQISVKDSAGNETTYTQKININKIDKTKPNISSINKETEEWVKELNIIVDANDSESGIMGYSFEDLSIVPRQTSLTYLQTNTYKVTKNTNIAVVVKDNANNISDEEIIEINNIDNIPPNIKDIDMELSEDKLGVYIIINAEDNQSGVSEYSFDGGITWKSVNEEGANKQLFDKSMTSIEPKMIAVRDIVGNETYYESEIVFDNLVENIEIATMPTNIEYERNTEPDLEGGTILVTYKNGSSSEIDMKDCVYIQNYNKTKLGEQKIKLIYQEKSVELTVYVIAPLESISLNETEISMNEGDEFTLFVTYNPVDTTDDKTITWTSTDENIAIVDETGKVTAVGKGTATITAETENGKTATCEVTVIDITPPEILVTKNIDEMTNNNVIVSLNSNEELQELEGWILSEDKKVLTKEYKNNETETVIVKDLSGNETVVDISVNNIDKKSPVASYKYGKTSYINNNITVEINFNEEVQELEGWKLSKDSKILTKEYSVTTEEQIQVKDIAGNVCELNINVIVNENDNTNNIISNNRYIPRILTDTARRFIFF